MAAKTVAEQAAQDPRLKAMWMELGQARLDDFPMEDGEIGKRRHDSRTASHTPNLTTDSARVIPRIPIKSAWAKAMQRGDFDDDDAAKVSDIDSMADGQLARARRNQAAATTTLNVTNDNYESNIRRDRSRYVPPRATAGTHGKRKILGPVHVGDGPIDINRTLSSTNRDPRPRPAREPTIAMGPLGRGTFAGAPSSRSSARPQPAAAKPPTQDVQGNRPAAEIQLRLVLPDGASVFLQLPATFAAAVFPKTSSEFRGKVYLISGSQSSEDMIILALEDKEISEIRYPMGQYDTYMSVSSVGLMLKFNESESGFNFYGVEFEKASSMKSFIEALQELADRPKQRIQSPATKSAAEGLSNAGGTIQPAVKMEALQQTPALPTKDVEFTATRISEVNADATPKAAVSPHKQEERKDRIARRLAKLQVTKQSEAACASSKTATGPRPIKDVPVSRDPVPEEAHGARVRKVSSLVAATALDPTDTSAATHLTSMSKPEEPEPVASREGNAGSRLWKPVQKQPVQAVDASIQKNSLSLEVDKNVVEQVMPHTAQAAGASVQQTQVPVVVTPETIKEMIELAWTIIRFMQHSDPDQCSFNDVRNLVRASCAAVIGHISPSFQKLCLAEQWKFVMDHAQVPVECGILRKMACDEPLVSEIASTDVGQAKKSQTREAVQAPAVASIKASGIVYNIEELMSMRHNATEVDPSMLLNIPRRSPNIVIPQPKQSLPRVPLAAQVQQAAAANSDWLKIEIVPEVSNKVDVLASFLSLAPGQKTKTSSPGLGDSIHNQGGIKPSDNEYNYLTGVTTRKSTYQKDLEGLIVQKADKGNAFNHKVVEATEGISRLRLD